MILPGVMSIATQHPRYLPEIEWSDKSITHNVFRVYEMLFWRRYGIRAEMTAIPGRQFFHSFESACAYAESRIRGLVPAPVKIWIPQLATPMGGFIPQSPFLFAIAFDAAANGGTAGSSWSHTCTGSNRVIFAANTSLQSVGTPSATYAAVSLTQVNQATTGPANYRQNLFYLAAPTTGANTLALGGSNRIGASSSYSGASQTGIPDNSNTGSNSTTSLTIATTTIADNCWVVMGMTTESSSNDSQTAGASTTQRSTTGTLDSSVGGIYDNNAAKTPAGSVSLIVTHGGTTPGMAGVTASFAPPGAASNTGFFLFMQ